MPDYSKGKIYTIRSLTDDNVYVGSTIQSLSVRMGGHRQAYKKNKMLGLHKDIVKNIDDWYIELYELYPCNENSELHKREGEIIRLIGTLNIQIAGRTNKQWRNDNVVIIKQNRKQYQNDNVEKNKQLQKDWRINNVEKIKQYQIDNAEKLKQNRKQYRINNAEKIKDSDKQYRQNNVEKTKERQQKYQIDNAKKLKEK